MTLTVAHKEVEDIPCHLKHSVVNSSYLNGKYFNIFALDMGDQIKIYDIASRIIRLSGYTIKNSNNINGDIPIKIIGLRERLKKSAGTNLKKQATQNYALR